MTMMKFAHGGNNRRAHLLKKSSSGRLRGLDDNEEEETVSSHTTLNNSNSNHELSSLKSKKNKKNPRRSLLRRHSGNSLPSLFGRNNPKQNHHKQQLKNHQKRGPFHQDAAVDFTHRSVNDFDDIYGNGQRSMFDYDHGSSDELEVDEFYGDNDSSAATVWKNHPHHSRHRHNNNKEVVTRSFRQRQDATILLGDIEHYEQTQVQPHCASTLQACRVHWDRADARLHGGNRRGAALSLKKLRTAHEQLVAQRLALEYLQDVREQIGERLEQSKSNGNSTAAATTATLDWSGFANYKEQVQSMLLVVKTDSDNDNSTYDSSHHSDDGSQNDPQAMADELEHFGQLLAVVKETTTNTTTLATTTQETTPNQILEI